MNFKSLDFVLLFPVVLAVVFILPARFRWAWLLAVSLFFYSRWRVAYIFLLIAHSLTDYVLGIAIHNAKTKARKRLFLAMSLTAGLGLLAYFKYLGFFLTSAYGVMGLFGHTIPPPHLDIVLPVGISFYTVQTLSYTIDMYRGQVVPERHPGYFMLFVTYFPHMVAGPIMRAPRLLGELHKTTRWDTDRVLSGLRRMAWGFFKKVVVADRLARFVELVFGDVHGWNGSMLLLGSYYFAFQVYCDFSGYSDIALGAARCIGHDLTENFDRPYLSTSVTEFWRRWHISLQTWFRDYLFIPLATPNMGLARQSLNLMIVFVVSGLWHGANWTFILWGAINGIGIVFENATRDLREGLAKRLKLDVVPAFIRNLIGRLLTFHFVLFSWIFFVSHSLGDAFIALRKIGEVRPAELAETLQNPRQLANILPIVVLLGVELWQTRAQARGVEDLGRSRPSILRYSLYAAIVVAIFVLGRFGPISFIYFQF